ncbi:MAG: ATP-dependent metallopeptidase FtsH/Yme1/Tma family protein [Bryobacteraceae bacterium]
MSSKSKIMIALLAAALVCAFILAWAVAGRRGGEPAISYSQFLQQVQAGRVAEVKIWADNSGADAASVRLKDGTTARTVLPSHYSVALDAMQRAMVNVVIQDASTNPTRLLINATPFLILLAFWVFFMTQGRPLLGPR